MILPIKHTNDGKEKGQSYEAEIDGRNIPMSWRGYSTISCVGYGSDRGDALANLRAELLSLQQSILDTVISIDTELGSVNFQDPDFVTAFREQQARGVAATDEVATQHNAKFVRETLAFIQRMLLIDAAAGNQTTAFSFETETEVNIAKQFATANGFTVAMHQPTPRGIPAFVFPAMHNISIEHGKPVVTP